MGSNKAQAAVAELIADLEDNDLRPVVERGKTSVARSRAGLNLSERRLLFAGCDIVGITAAFIVAFNLPVRQQHFTVLRFVTTIAIAIAVWVAMASTAGAYDVVTFTSHRRTIQAILAAVALSLVAVLAVFFLYPYGVTRLTILLWVPLSAVLVLTFRLLVLRAIAQTVISRIVIVCPTSTISRISDDIGPSLGGLYELAAVIDPDAPDGLDQLNDVISDTKICQVVVGVRDQVGRHLFEALVRLHQDGVVVRSLAELYEELTGRVLLDQLGHSWLMSLPMPSATSRPYAVTKRVIDITAGVVATALLVVAIVPLAIAIKLSSRGPVFHRQLRIGRFGETFWVAKLRTMRTTPSLDWTTEGDPRITGVGRWLRRLHLDELPQGWDILRGNMSVVGPRPEQPHYVSRLSNEIDFYRSRLVVRPGLTGWAQLNHGYGPGIDGARIKLAYDLYYVKHQSFSLDLLVLARTFLAVLRFQGR